MTDLNPADESDSSPLDPKALREDFPLLARKVKGKRVVYLDSAASAQKPRQVLDAMTDFYSQSYANVHRGVYEIAEEATDRVEHARATVARFIGARDRREVIFTKNATESLNLVARAWGSANLGPGDAVVLTQLEHHANIVPWQMLAVERGFEIRWIPVTDTGVLILDDLDVLLDGAKMLSITAMSNVVGTRPDITALTERAHRAGALVSVDACQHVPHHATDVQAWDADFVSFSAHKLCGPSGIGVLWGRQSILEEMPPFLGGGGMILDVTMDGFIPDGIPGKFEAGTPPIAEAVGLEAAIEYLEAIGMDRIEAHEGALTAAAMRILTDRFGESLTIHGPAEPAARGGVLSLALDDVHPHDLAQVLDQHAVCVRPGHHCAKPLMRVLGVGATARASVYLYNDTDDIEALADGLAEASEMFRF